MTPTPQPPHEPHPNHDRGLEFDLSTLMSRRSLGMFLGAGTAAALAACTPGGSATGARPPHGRSDGVRPDAGILRNGRGHGHALRLARPR